MTVEYLGQSGISLKAMPHYLATSTGTGSAQTFNHGLGRIPEIVIVSAAASTVSWSYSVTATTLTVTVASGAYSVLCLTED
jgi:hypothetical protein